MPDLGFVDFTTLGTGADGDVIISADTDLGSSNVKNYNSLTVDSTKNLHGNSGMEIRVRSVLSLSGTIHVNGKVTTTDATNGSNGRNGGGGGSLLMRGGSGGIAQTGETGGIASTVTTALSYTFTTNYNVGGSIGGGDSPGTAGAGGGNLKVHAYVIIGTGTISANGSAGGNAGSNPANFGGGGGGGSGGYVNVYSNTTISAITISANGGTGGYGGTPLSLGGGGGGGGSGGYVSQNYGVSSSATLSASAGSGGNAGAGATDTAGVAGTAGFTESYLQ